ncbi:MAG: phenylacetate-CoA oxygenase subunit PaaI [Defluviicoccus sp.]|nr:phenylacetate-CoA oxygenase subunit PaaI [Defluviicoccus sp.]
MAPTELDAGAPIYGPSQITEEAFRDTPDEYQELVRWVVGRQLLEELSAACIFAKAAPLFYREGPEKVRYCIHLAEEEVGHCRAVARILPGIGLDYSLFANHDRPYAQDFHGDPDFPRSWEDVLVFNWLAEESGRLFLWSMRDTSYAPYANVNRAIIAEEERHAEGGPTHLIRHIEENGNAAREKVQASVDEWFPKAIRLLGVPRSEKQQKFHYYGLKAEDTEEQLPLWLDAVLPYADRLGLTVPTSEDMRATGLVLPSHVDW